MPDQFVPLALYLRGEPQDPIPGDVQSPETTGESDERLAPAEEYEEIEESIRAARRFRAGLADAMDVHVPALLREIAGDVLARELTLQDADVAAIVEAALTGLERETVLAVRVHPQDADAVAPLGIPLVADGALARGDVSIELQCGTIDMRLAARLERALAACLP